MDTDHELLLEIKGRQDLLQRQLQEVRELKMAPAPAPVGGVHQVVMQHPDGGERAAHRVEKYFVAMVVLNICMGFVLAANWITDTNQSYVINAIYMMAPGLQQQIEAKKEAGKP
jgi:hypothetical protein